MSTTAAKPTTDRTGVPPEEGNAPPAQKRRRSRKVKDDASAPAGPLWTFLAWLLTLIFFAPVAWMVLTSLHSETDAATNPPSLGAGLTLQGYEEFFGASTGQSPWPPL